MARTYGTGTKVAFEPATDSVGGYRAAVEIAGKADILVLWGDVYTSAAVAETLYVAPVAADPGAEPPVEEVIEVLYVAPQPSRESFRLIPGIVRVEAGASTLNLFSPNSDADVRVLLYTDAP